MAQSSSRYLNKQWKVTLAFRKGLKDITFLRLFKLLLLCTYVSPVYRADYALWLPADYPIVD